MQRMKEGKGGSLLFLYDSGMLTLEVKVSVARKLNSKTVRRGSISITVVGGGQTQNEGGVENNYLLTLFRVLQGRTGNFRKIHFLKGFRDFFVNISTRALALALALAR